MDKMDKEANRGKKLIQAGSAVALAAFLASCSPEANGNQEGVNLPQAQESGGVVNPENLITSGEYEEVTDKSEHDTIVSSLPEGRPGALGGDDNIHTFKIDAGGRNFKFAIYDVSAEDAPKQPGVELTDKDGKSTTILQTKALYAEYFGYDGSSSWERLVLVAVPEVSQDGKPTGETGVVWVYDEKGFPKTEEERSIDLSRPVLSYFIPLEKDSTMSFTPVTSDPELLVKIDPAKPITVTPEKEPSTGFREVALYTSSGTIGEPVSAISTATPEIQGLLPGDLKIVTDLEKPEEFPRIEFEELRSEGFVEKLISMDERGLLPKVPEGVRPFENISFHYGEPTGKIHYGQLFGPDWPYKYSIITNRSWVVVGFWNTQINGVDTNVPVLKFKNKDNSYGYLGIVVSADIDLQPPIQPWWGGMSAMKETTDYIPSGLYFEDDYGVERFESYSYGKSLYGHWFLENQDEFVASGIFQRWETNGVLNNKDEGGRLYLPLIPCARRYTKG